MIISKRMLVFTVTPEEYETIKEFVKAVNLELAEPYITFREFEQIVDGNDGKKIKCECWVD